MNRREFLQNAAVSLAAAPLFAGSGNQTEVALTFDDPTTENSANLTWQEINKRILATMTKRRIKTALFVCGKRVQGNAGQELIAAWNAEGHLICNHSYSHLNFNQSAKGGSGVTLRQFEADALKNEALIRGSSHFTKLFRYPFFKEGETEAKRDGMRAFLKEHGYRMGRATVDASDWAIDARLRKRAGATPAANLSAYRDYYLQHIWERAQYYDSLGQRLLGQPVRHTVLLHHSALNALYADDLVGMFLAHGWKVVDAEYAYRDPIYDRQPQILPAGESLLWALAKESGRFEKELRYPGEDDVYENPRMDALKL